MSEDTYNNMSSEAVARATGKDWQEWFVILDAWKAIERPHREIADYLHKEQGVPPWWCQMITVGYEQARGLRVPNQKTDGFAVTVSKVLPYDIERVYQAWMDDQRANWLRQKLTITTTTENKSLRAKLPDNTRLSIGFYPKRDNKMQVALQHEKLAHEKDVERQREFWKEAIETLEQYLTQQSA